MNSNQPKPNAPVDLASELKRRAAEISRNRPDDSNLAQIRSRLAQAQASAAMAPEQRYAYLTKGGPTARPEPELSRRLKEISASRRAPARLRPVSAPPKLVKRKPLEVLIRQPIAIAPPPPKAWHQRITWQAWAMLIVGVVLGKVMAAIL